MAPEITVAIIASVPGIAAAISVWKSTHMKDIKDTVVRIENKMDRHIEWHLTSCSSYNKKWDLPSK